MAKKQAPQSPPGLADKVDKPKRIKPVLLVVAIVLLAMALSVVATWLLLRSGNDDDAAQQPAAEAGLARKPAIYEALMPAFVVNYDYQGRQRYLQVSMTLMGRDAEAMNALKHHAPVLRNRLVLLLGRQEFEALSTPAGKEVLRQQVTADIQELAQKEVGSTVVEQVLFTNFVLQ